MQITFLIYLFEVFISFHFRMYYFVLLMCYFARASIHFSDGGGGGGAKSKKNFKNFGAQYTVLN